MAKNGNTALTFVDDLANQTLPFFEEEQALLRANCQQYLAKDSFEPWDVSYLMEKVRCAKYDFDSDALRRFFRVDDVISGMFSLTQDLYGVSFEELPTFYTEDENATVPEGKTSIWHPEVKYYAIYE